MLIVRCPFSALVYSIAIHLIPSRSLECSWYTLSISVSDISRRRVWSVRAPGKVSRFIHSRGGSGRGGCRQYQPASSKPYATYSILFEERSGGVWFVDGV